MGRLAIFLFLAGLAGCGSGQVPSEVLAERAVNGPPSEQEAAVLELGRRGPDAVPHLRRVMLGSSVPLVRAAAIQSIGAFQDYPSGPELFAAMDDPNPLVRGRAAAALTTIIGADYHYNADDPPQKRALAKRGMKQSYDQMAGNPNLKR